MQKLSVASTSRDEIGLIVQEALEDVISFVQTEEFQGVLQELHETPTTEKPKFVVDILLSDKELEKRGISVPEGLLIQRSTFADNRPTLFCVSKKLPHGCLWEKVTVTFDNPPD